MNMISRFASKINLCCIKIKFSDWFLFWVDNGPHYNVPHVLKYIEMGANLFINCLPREFYSF